MTSSIGSGQRSEEILAKLRAIAPDRIGVEPELLQVSALLEEVGIDSYALIELVFVAEEQFKVRIPTEGLVVRTVGDVVELIGRQLDAQADNKQPPT